MNKDKYVGMDVDQATCVIWVEDGSGKGIIEAFVKTSATELREFFKGLKGKVQVAIEEGAQAAWIYELIEPLVYKIVVCDARKIKGRGNKADRTDARKLARLLRLGELVSVYQGTTIGRELKELVRGYNYLVKDIVRTKSRMKAAFRSRGVRCRGTKVYEYEGRKEWLGKIDVEALNARVSSLYEQLACQNKLKDEAEKAMIACARKNRSYDAVIRQPGFGPIRTAQVLGIVGVPERFRTKRQFWPYCGFAVVTQMSSEYEVEDGQRRRKKKHLQTRGLNQNFNRTLKAVFKGAAETAITIEPFKQYYNRLIEKKIRPEMATLTVARKIAAITLSIMKTGEEFDPERVNNTVPDSGDQ